MGFDHLLVPPGQARTFAVAGVVVTVHSADSSRPARLPASFSTFLAPGESSEIEIHVASRTRLEPTRGTLLYDSKLHWRAAQGGPLIVFEFRYPPSSLLYCQAMVQPDFSRAEVLFSKEAWKTFAEPNVESWDLPYPLDQLLLVPALALRGAVLLHACGAVVSDRSLVFAGHSGDGKTTLAGLLHEEGVTLLSDERIAIRKAGGGFIAHGTPWPGEGNIVSSARHPLGGLFLLRKAPHHSLGRASTSLAPDLIARAIVPYYLPQVAGRILEIFSDLAGEVPLRELLFSRSPGLESLLRNAA